MFLFQCLSRALQSRNVVSFQNTVADERSTIATTDTAYVSTFTSVALCWWVK